MNKNLYSVLIKKICINDNLFFHSSDDSIIARNVVHFSSFQTDESQKMPNLDYVVSIVDQSIKICNVIHGVWGGRKLLVGIVNLYCHTTSTNSCGLKQ